MQTTRTRPVSCVAGASEGGFPVSAQSRVAAAAVATTTTTTTANTPRHRQRVRLPRLLAHHGARPSCWHAQRPQRCGVHPG